MHRGRISLIHAAITAMLTLGVTAILTSIAYTSSVLAFIGLGLVFWGYPPLHQARRIHKESPTRSSVVSFADDTK
jgi:hypothetical protein